MVLKSHLGSLSPHRDRRSSFITGRVTIGWLSNDRGRLCTVMMAHHAISSTTFWPPPRPYLPSSSPCDASALCTDMRPDRWLWICLLLFFVPSSVSPYFQIYFIFFVFLNERYKGEISATTSSNQNKKRMRHQVNDLKLPFGRLHKNKKKKKKERHKVKTTCNHKKTRSFTHGVDLSVTLFGVTHTISTTTGVPSSSAKRKNNRVKEKRKEKKTLNVWKIQTACCRH